jgi:hypothetical protein
MKSGNPVKDLVDSKEFKELAPYKQKQQYYKLLSRLGRRIEPKVITSNI